MWRASETENDNIVEVKAYWKLSTHLAEKKWPPFCRWHFQSHFLFFTEIAVFCLNVKFDPWRYVKYPSITLWNVFIKVFHTKSFIKIISGMWQISRKAYNLITIQCRKNERDGVSNHRCLHCLLLFQVQVKENIKAPRHWPLWPVTGEFPAQKASDAENIPIWWRHHDMFRTT